MNGKVRLTGVAQMKTASARASPIPALQIAKTAKMPQRQIPRPYPPHHCQHGGAPRANRRQHRHNIRQMAALPVLAARHFGDKMIIRLEDCIFLLANS
jgi:hypothetical protein